MKASSESDNKEELQDLKLALEQSRRALEVEACLEEVRAASMAMKESNQLREVVRVLYEQLEALNFDTQFVSIALCHPEENQIEYWSADNLDSDHDFSYFVKGRKNHIIRKMWANWKDQGTISLHLKGERKKKFDAYLLTQTDFKSLPKKVKQSMRRQKEVWFTSASMRYGFIASAYGKPLTAKKLKTLERFARVFEQAYTRFLDLQKAEAQAREAQIEAALERVRAASMAMHKTEELAHVVKVIFRQFQELDIEVIVSFIGIHNWEDQVVDQWHSSASSAEVFFIQWPMEHFQDEINKWRRGDEFVYVSVEGTEAVKAYVKQLDQISQTTMVSEMQKELGFSRVEHTEANHRYGNLGLIQTRKSTDEERDIVWRFSKVFEQAYTRFLDLQRAEQQARDAQVEAALERVRAASMAMHQSDELRDVVKMTFEQLQGLDLTIGGCQIQIVEEGSKDLHVWSATPEMTYPQRLNIPYFKHATLDQFWKAYDRGDSVATFSVSRKETLRFYQHAYDHSELGTTIHPDRWRSLKVIKHGHSISWSIRKYTGLFVFNFQEHIYTAYENSILGRFATAFEQVYTRFLDLEKAEAQARDAQIETALERVRATSMAMHDSTALAEIAQVVFEQMNLLGIPLSWTWFSIIQDDERTMHTWHTHVGGTFNPDPLVQQISDYAHSEKMMTAWRDQVPFVENDWAGDALRAYTELMAQVPGYKKTTSYKALLKNQDRTLYETDAVFKYGFLGISSFENREEEHREILVRFAAAFSHAYTRFLDIRKAEAQARAARIEAALERVRAASMAMHDSHELPSVALTVFNQLSELGITNLGNSILLIDEKKNTYRQYSAHDDLQKGEKILNVVEDLNWPTHTHLVSTLMKAIRAGEKDVVIPLRGKHLQEFIDFTRDHAHRQRGEAMEAAGFKCVYFYHSVFHAFSNLAITTLEPIDRTDQDILRRMADTFGQSHLRYLDLKKAEAQAKKAQIEAALERVRAASMAMHNSAELRQVVAIFYQQLGEMAITDMGFNINLFDANTGEAECFLANRALKELPKSYRLQMREAGHYVLREGWQSWTNHEPNITFDLRGPGTADFANYLFANTELSQLPDEAKEVMRSIEGVHFFINTKYGQLHAIDTSPFHDDEVRTLHRFAGVFEQTYTRFLDLKKAEALAKEAQIEAALERVRAASMAMRSSEELPKVVAMIFDQLSTLGVEADTCQINILKPNSKDLYLYTAVPGHTYPKVVHVPYKRNALIDTFGAKTTAGPKVVSKVFSRRSTKAYFKHILSNSELSELASEERKAKALSIDKVAASGVFTRYGALVIGDYSGNLHGGEDLEILSRMAVVFEQTYRRFLDIQKAEAQAREAQIEAALERVRAASMAMHSSADIPNTTLVLLQQLEGLGLPMFAASINIADDNFYELSVADNTTEPPRLVGTGQIPHNDFWLSKLILTRLGAGEKMMCIEASGKKLRTWIDWTGERISVSRAEQLRQAELKKTYWHVAQFHELSHLILSGPSPLKESQLRTLKRFASVFEQAYIRYLDLQKAEAQAHEAQIEAALERVRAASMAMHNSDQFTSVAITLAEQIEVLGITSLGFSISFIDPEERTFVNYSADRDFNTGTILMGEHPPQSIDDLEISQQVLKRIESGEEFFMLEVKGDLYEENIHHQVDQYGTDRGINKDHFEKIFVQVALFYDYSTFGLVTSQPLNEEHQNILKRLVDTFRQSYIRLLDIQRAEAQAREARIEATLERVRAASLAMHDSQDLMKVIDVVYQQISSLDIPTDVSAINTHLDDPDAMTVWSAIPTEKFPCQVRVPLIDHPISNSYRNVIAEKQALHTDFIAADDLHTWYRHIFENTTFGDFTSQERRDQVFSTPGVHRTTITAKHSILSSWNFAGRAYSSEENTILQRIHRAFEQAYVRYLDLKMAEAQSREAQIEAALERVRARTMAMHHSSDLAEAAAELFSQLRALGGELWSCGFVLCEEDNPIDIQWMAAPDAGLMDPHSIPHEEEPIHQKMYEGWLAGDKIFTHYLDEAANGKMLQFLMSIPSVRANGEKLKKAGLELPATQHMHAAYFKYGYLLIITLEKYDDLDVFARFAQVFEQTFTRFLDLQKAEALAREAEIEAALERVRAASMAMHESQDLMKVVDVVYEQIALLKIPNDLCAINTHLDHPDAMTVWSAVSTEKFPRQVQVPHSNNPVTNNYKKIIEEGIDLYTEYLDQAELRLWYHHVLDNSEFGKFTSNERRKSVLNAPGAHQTFSGAKNSILSVWNFLDYPYSEEDNSIIQRIHRAFEQAYIRYLDLQKAEARAHEAQIEAALERVRASAMAMHQSEDLINVADVLRLQLGELGQPAMESCLIHQYDLKEDELTAFWAYKPELDKGNKTMRGTSIVPFEACELTRLVRENYRSTKTSYVIEARGKLLRNWYKQLLKLAPETVEMKKGKPVLPPVLFYHFSKFDGGALLSISEEQPNDAALNLQGRASSVFELAYTRFLDLKKAEAQAREAQIEAALERIRAAAMAMHRTDELINVVRVLRHQMAAIGETELDSMVIHLYKDDADTFEGWFGYRHRDNPDGEVQEGHCIVDWNSTERCRRDKEMYYSEEQNYTITGDKKLLREWYKYLSRTVPQSIEYGPKGKMIVPDYLYYNYSKFSNGALVLITNEVATGQSKDLLARAAKVFNLAYTRFLDLQKAEAQTRASQIEASLERVRNHAIAMENSSQVNEVVSSIHGELYRLGIPSASCYIYVVNDDAIDLWLTKPSKSGIEASELRVDWRSVPALAENHKRWSRGDSDAVYEFKGKEVQAWYKALESGSTGAFQVPERVPTYQQNIEVFSGFGGIGILNFEEQKLAEILPTLTRFGKSFEQVYTRFRDLQKAEAQAREAQIEAALERIRSTALAMHHSSELINTVNAILEQITTLGIPIHAVHIYEFIDQLRDYNIWASAPGQQYAMKLNCPPFKHPIFTRWQEAFDRGENYFALQVGKGEKNRFFRHFFKNSVHDVPEDRQQLILGAPSLSLAMTIQKHTGVAFIRYQDLPLSEDESSIMKRLAVAFEQAYTRFLDLKRSEEQAREAEIEVSLELVRATALAMQHSEDLGKVAETVFTELNRLGIDAMRCGIGLIDKESRQVDMWTTTLSVGKKQEQVTGNEILAGHPLLDGIYSHWLRQEAFTYALSGNDLKDYYKVIASSNFQLPDEVANPITPTCKHFYLCVMNPSGGLYAFKESAWTEEAIAILQRFTDAFYLAYRRYEDLQKAEARARETLREAAVDRIRAEIASMRTSADLERITPLVWKELNTLEVPFFRCGVFIIDEVSQTVQAFLSTPLGDSLAALTLPYSSSDIVLRTVDHWHKQQTMIQEWDRNEFIAWTKSLAEQGLLDDKASYQGQEQPPEHLALHFVPFAQGMLYVGHSEKLSTTQLEDVQDLAQAFTVAYARYEDFNRLEKTLNELQSTQDQLIQSEKMASLGELTAGIAHEIQNPLNFVNNFSEVSGELLFEIEEELEKPDAQRDHELMEEILEDLKQNLTKINHHGARASGIVKGMLDHSRTSSGEKTPTDINSIVDEYLRLAYHGLRAKDKTFQAKFTADLEEDLPLANVVAQDMGRVILNLINNAFYTVHKKAKSQDPNYKFQPEVIVSTKLFPAGPDVVVIQVQDNGQGMAPDIADKIFQPFFTTKPTGEGTGLGLSLSYDIVTKGHGGTLEVESEEGVGTVFKIKIPVQ